MAALSTTLRGHDIVALDTNCFIYYLEGGSWAAALKECLFGPVERGELQAVTSVLTLTELLVRPISLGRFDVADEYSALINSYPHLRVVPLTIELAVRSAELRARFRVRTPDAIQLATAVEARASLFLTNDAGMPGHVDSLRVAILKDLLPPPKECLQRGDGSGKVHELPAW
ncbi:MAG: PIN domain-containing protein [Bacillota bacterium]